MTNHKDYPNLCRVLAGINGSENLTTLSEEVQQTPSEIFNDYFSDVDEDNLQEMDDAVGANESLFEDFDYELPIEGDNDDFDELAKNNKSIRELYNAIAHHDDTDEWGQ